MGMYIVSSEKNFEEILMMPSLRLSVNEYRD
jgi:hypothetical protein